MGEIRRVAVDQFAAAIVILGQEPVRAAVDLLHRVVTGEVRKRLRVNVDTDVVPRGRFALHDRAPAQVGLNVGVVRRHQGDDGLTQPRSRLRSKIPHSR